MTNQYLIVKDDENCHYPTVLDAAGVDEVYVGRIRKDLDYNKSLSFWIVADNLQKGASTNAIQILERLIKRQQKNDKCWNCWIWKFRKGC